LAYEIQKEISNTGRQPPKISTLEKRISSYKSVFDKEPDSLDEPWTVLSLANPDHNIPPEALPAVIKTQAHVIRFGDAFSVREALWVSRFYYIFKGTEFDFDSDPGLVRTYARKYTRKERVYEVLRNAGKLPDKETLILLLKHDDTVLYSFMTGDMKPLQIVIKKIRHNPELSDWFFEDESEDKEGLPLDETEFEELLKQTSQMLKQVGQKKGKKEVQNERTHNQKG
jgi:hypothetical protein